MSYWTLNFDSAKTEDTVKVKLLGHALPKRYGCSLSLSCLTSLQHASLIAEMAIPLVIRKIEIEIRIEFKDIMVERPPGHIPRAFDSRT